MICKYIVNEGDPRGGLNVHEPADRSKKRSAALAVHGDRPFRVICDCLDLQSGNDRFSNRLHICGGLEAGDHEPFPINQELREVPFDIGFFAEGLVVYVLELFKRGVFQPLSEPLERLL